MSKIFKLKKWLSLEDTAKRLSLSLNEDISVKDILQAALDNHLNISILLNNQSVCEIKRFNNLHLNKVDTERYLKSGKYSGSLGKCYEGGTLRIYSGEDIQKTYSQGSNDYVGDWFDVSGAYNLNLDKTPVGDAIYNWVTNNEYINKSYYRPITINSSEGKLLAIVEDDPDSEDVTIEGKKVHVILKELINIYEPPNFNQLVVLRSDIEKFERHLNDDNNITEAILELNPSITNTKTWQNLYLATELAVKEFPNWKLQQTNPNKIPMNSIDSWLDMKLKINKRESETVKKVLKEIFAL